MNLGKVVVTGSRGFLGRRLMRALEAHTMGPEDRVATTLDLREEGAAKGELEDAIESDYDGRVPDVLFHLAARCGGIGANQRRPGEFFHDNMLMGINVLEAAREIGVRKVVMVGTVCSYPKYTPTPFHEDDLWKGYPEETNAAYGVAKRALITMAQAYRQQYGMNIITLIPANLYGPGDNFDLEDAHVIPAMIRKYEDARAAGAPEVELWGTGQPTREFLYVEDCAAALIAAAERYDDGAPVNLGTGYEISMADLASVIANCVGYKGRTVWNAAKPDGQPRRSLDTSKANALFGWAAATALIGGLTKTLSWYRQNWAAIAAGERP